MLKLIILRIFCVLVSFVLITDSQAEEASGNSVQSQAGSELIEISSLVELQNLSFPSLNKGILYNLVNSNLSRYGSSRTVLNYLAKRNFTIKPILHPGKPGESGLEISVFLLPQQDYQIVDKDLFEILEGLLIEINNTLAYFGRKLKFNSLTGTLIERFADGSEGRRFSIPALMKLLTERKKLSLISDRILAMHRLDSQMRMGQTTVVPEIRQSQINTLKKIVSWIGWPTVSRVGPDASHAAWALTQHADFDIAFQKTALEFLEKSKKGDINTMEIAYLTDRIRVAEGQHQVYGTQYILDEKGQIFPRPIEDFANLDKRRQTMGLEPFNEYLESLYRAYGIGKEGP